MVGDETGRAAASLQGVGELVEQSDARFDGQVVLVTGAANGIGAASAHAFAGWGAHVVLIDVDDAGGQREVRRISDVGGSAEFTAANVTDSESISTILDRVMRDHGRLDAVHANAGIEFASSIPETTPEAWRHVIDVNLTGVYITCHYAFRHMARQNRGAFVVTSSVHAQVSAPGLVAYAAAKAGLVMMTKVLALEGATYGIRANAILPAAVDTPMLRREANATPDPADMYRTFAACHPLNRIATPAEIARAVLFLASPAASFITGTTVAVDGGMLAVQPSGPTMTYA